MQLRHLEYFVAIAEHGSISAAAEHLHVVQSGISSAIRVLEREVGADLFERGPRGVSLTDAGKALLPLARRGLANVADMFDAVDEVRHGLRGTVKVGVIPALGHVDVTAAIAAFRRSHPGVTISVQVGGSGTLAHDLERDRLDFALLSPVGPMAQAVTLHSIASSPFEVLLPPGNGLEGAAEVSLEQLVEYPVVDSPTGFGNRDLLDAEMTRRGLHRDVVVESPDAWSIPTLVALGTGAALVPAFVAARADASVTRASLPVSDRIEWPLYLATARDHQPSTAARLLAQAILATRAFENAVTQPQQRS